MKQPNVRAMFEAAFDEWLRRALEQPDVVPNEEYGDLATYGQDAADYFLTLMAEQSSRPEKVKA